VTGSIDVVIMTKRDSQRTRMISGIEKNHTDIKRNGEKEGNLC
jgi:hypothetical protein